MNIYSFDNSFEGLLTLVFDCYQNNCFPDEILFGEGSQQLLFASTIDISTEESKEERVWNGIVAHSS